MQLHFFPYFGGSALSWTPVIEKLPDFHDYAYTLHDIGGTPYSVRQAIDDVANRLILSEDEEFILVGHSMGGKLALGIAAQQPENLRGVVLIAPSPPTPEAMPESVRQRMLSTHGSRAAAFQTIEGASYRELSPDILETAVDANLAYSETDWKNWLETGSKEDISDLLPLIKVPVLVLTGQHDENMTPELLTREIVEKIPGARLEVVVGAGHLLPLEVPEELAELIRGFVFRVGG